MGNNGTNVVTNRLSVVTEKDVVKAMYVVDKVEYAQLNGTHCFDIWISGTPHTFRFNTQAVRDKQWLLLKDLLTHSNHVK